MIGKSPGSRGFYYQLDDKHQDAAFLKGEPVLGRAVLSPKEEKEDLLREGEAILILLSTGAKYKGRIIQFTRVMINGYAVGELEIVKHTGR
jgi:hypothetical protein